MLGVPGIGLWALVHTYTGFCLSLFMVVHIYLGTTGATLGELFRFMWFGDTEIREPASPIARRTWQVWPRTDNQQMLSPKERA